jgi:hypothetical protein
MRLDKLRRDILYALYYTGECIMLQLFHYLFYHIFLVGPFFTKLHFLAAGA